MINTSQFRRSLVNSIVMLMCENKYVGRSIVKADLNSDFYKATSNYIFKVLVDNLYVYEYSSRRWIIVHDETFESDEIYINMLKAIYDYIAANGVAKEPPRSKRKPKVGEYFFGRLRSTWGIWRYDYVGEDGATQSSFVKGVVHYDDAVREVFKLNGWGEPSEIKNN